MSKPLTLRGKFILTAVSLMVFAVCLYILNVQIESAILLLLLFPVIIILLGKVGELIIHALETISTGPLALTNLRSAVLLVFYYSLLSIFLAFLIENSAILSIVDFKPNELQVAVTSLSIAFLPRVLSYASGMERARNILLAVLTPLTLTAAVALFVQPATLTLRLQTLKLCFVGSIILPITGDLTLFFVGSLGVINPVITFETISLLDLQRLVLSQLEVMKWDNICQILEKAKHVNRSDVVNKILLAMDLFTKESRRRGAKYARIVFIDALTDAACSEPSLKQELIPLLKAFNKDEEIEVRTRVVASYAFMSKLMPDESLECLSELLDDKEIKVLEAVGSVLTILLKDNREAADYTIKLSLNPAFLDWLIRQVETPHRIALRETMREVYFRESMQDIKDEGTLPAYIMGETMGGTLTISTQGNPILRSLKAAYISSPDTILVHIQHCCSSDNVKLRVLAAAIVSDEEFTKNDKRLAEIRKKLKNDKSGLVTRALEFTRIKRLPRGALSHMMDVDYR